MKSRRVLITGSSRGIGRAIATRLAADGWQVALHYALHGEEAEEVRKSLGGRVAGCYGADLSQRNGPAKLWEMASADGPIDALVNNAGIYLPCDFLKSGEAAFAAIWHKTFAINFEAPVELMRRAAKSFASSGGGSILNVCSRVGFKGESGAGLYAASKAALINMTRSLAVELAPQNVRLFGIAPGWVETAMARDGMENRLDEILAGIPVGRMATPEDCAGAASFLLSESAAYLSGVVIDINGASYFH